MKRAPGAARGVVRLMALGFVLFGSAAWAAPGDTTRVSIASDGTQANGSSSEVNGLPIAISADGRHAAFGSYASNLVAGDTNGFRDVFVHDRQTGETTRVSVASDGTQANSDASDPVISADGQIVAFWSQATNLVAGDTNGYADVFVHDRSTGETTRVSVASGGGEANSSSGSMSLSGSGRYIAFSTSASNLVSGDSNNTTDVFVHDRATGQTTRVSVASSGAQASGGVSDLAAITSDGRFVAFRSGASNLVSGDTNGRGDIFVHDRQTGETSRVSVASDGTQGNGNSAFPAISADGRYVAFGSDASNLVVGDTNGGFDVFLHDRQTGATTRVNVASDGTQASADYATRVTISGDGRFVGFASSANNLVSDDAGFSDSFVHDQVTGETTRVSVVSGGAQANGQSWVPGIDADGSVVAFRSAASNLISADTNNVEDVFAHELAVDVLPTDTDSDGVPDATDNCPDAANSDQSDGDQDGIGLACDADESKQGPEDPQIRPEIGEVVSVQELPAESERVGTTNAIVVVHGWNSAPSLWAEGMANAIAGQIFERQKSGLADRHARWFVGTLNWQAAAGYFCRTCAPGIPPKWAHKNARVQGEALGKWLVAGGFDYVHLVGHSAGSQVIQSAVEKLRNSSTKPVFVHSTYFDAYHPEGESFAAYGTESNWSEQFVDMRDNIYDTLEETNLVLPGAFNFDVTRLDPDQSTTLIGAHAWPYDWYRHTIDAPQIWTYGWGTTKEYDVSRRPSHNDLARGGLCELVSESTICMDPTSMIRRWVFSPIAGLFDPWWNPSAVSVSSSPTGTVSLATPQKVAITVGSPVWVRFTANTDRSFNSLRFKYAFSGGTDGLLTVFVDDKLVFKADQRVADLGENGSGIVPVGIVNPGQHSITLRLDHFAASSPTVTIADLEVGVIQLEETVNVAPVADAGDDQVVTTGVLVHLSGVESNDPDSRPLPLAYQWSQVSGPGVVLEESASPTPSFEALSSGTFTFSLVVHDGHEFSVPAIVRVTAISDSSPPTITPSVSGVPGNDGWYTSDLSVNWAVSDPESQITSSSGCGAVSITSDSAGQTFTCTATSDGGTTTESVTIRRDATPPAATATPSPMANGAGWNAGSVTVRFSGSDATSGVASCSPDEVLSAEGEGQSASGTCTDQAGNVSEPATVSGINIDRTAPAVTATATPVPGPSGWNTSAVTVSFAATDALSGVAADGCDSPVTVTGDGRDQAAQGTCRDRAGNAGSATLGGINIDRTAPMAVASATPPPNANGWNSTDVTVSFDGADSLSGSGVASCSPPTVLSGEGAGLSASGRCTDIAGNTSAAATAGGINIDRTAPIVSITTPPNAASYPSGSTVIADYQCSDALSGVGSCTGPVADGAAIDTTTSGNRSFGVSAVDLAGNSAGASTSYSVTGSGTDTTPPSISPVVEGMAGENGWYRSDVSVRWDVRDPESPVTGQVGCATSVVTRDTKGTTFRCEATSAGGTSKQSVTVKRDVTEPAIAVLSPWPGVTYPRGIKVPALYGCADLGSGVANCSGTVKPWALIDTSTPGIKTFTVTSRDRAGNTRTTNVEYRVQ